MGLRTLVDRLEPWAVLLSLVGIVFWQHKGVCWAVLVGVGVVKVVRTWSEAFTPFSHDTIADLLRALGFLGTVLALYFTLHALWPAMAHRDPRLTFSKNYTLHLGEAAAAAELRIESEGHDWRVTFGAVRDGQLVQGASGTLYRSDVIRGFSEGFARPMRLRGLTGNLAAGDSRAWIQLEANGAPKNIRLSKIVNSNARDYFVGTAR